MKYLQGTGRMDPSLFQLTNCSCRDTTLRTCDCLVPVQSLTSCAQPAHSKQHCLVLCLFSLFFFDGTHCNHDMLLEKLQIIYRMYSTVSCGGEHAVGERILLGGGMFPRTSSSSSFSRATVQYSTYVQVCYCRPAEG